MKILIFLLFAILPVSAGNLLPGKQFAVDAPGQRADYYLTSPTILFDNDVEWEVRYKAVLEVNDKLEDIQLLYTVSPTDYGAAVEYESFWRQPDRIFVHLGTGKSGGQFTATLFSYTNQPGTCRIYLHKPTWLSSVVTIKNKVNILKHELYHCLRWDHSFVTTDLDHWDNVEVLKRLYDKNNKQKAIIATIEPNAGVITFQGKKNKVITRDSVVKLRPDTYVSYPRKWGVTYQYAE